MLAKFRKQGASGFTLIELMIVVAIIGILAAVAIPAFVRYMRKAKTVEATESLDKIKQGARSYYQSERYNTSGNLEVKQFPGAGWSSGNAAPTSQGDTCCAAGTAKCSLAADQKAEAPAGQAAWSQGPWLALKFALNEPHYFIYAFSSAGQTNAATYTATAWGNLDCDDTMSKYQLAGSVDSEGAVKTVGPMVTSEIE